jgi:hypothetical protein
MDPAEYAREFQSPTRVERPVDRGASRGVLVWVKGRRAKRALDALQVLSMVGERPDAPLTYSIGDQWMELVVGQVLDADGRTLDNETSPSS